MTMRMPSLIAMERWELENEQGNNEQ
jgi:hypothetical protein